MVQEVPISQSRPSQTDTSPMAHSFQTVCQPRDQAEWCGHGWLCWPHLRTTDFSSSSTAAVVTMFQLFSLLWNLVCWAKTTSSTEQTAKSTNPNPEHSLRARSPWDCFSELTEFSDASFARHERMTKLWGEHMLSGVAFSEHKCVWCLINWRAGNFSAWANGAHDIPMTSRCTCSDWRMKLCKDGKLEMRNCFCTSNQSFQKSLSFHKHAWWTWVCQCHFPAPSSTKAMRG